MAGYVNKRNNCRLCFSTHLELVFKLNSTPPANAFLSLTEIQQGHGEEKFPLELYFCKSCYHLQLLHIVDPKILFSHYLYVSGTSPSFVEHFRKYSETVTDLCQETPSFILEIGSNDGTLLKFFKKQGSKVLGIDPAENLAKSSNEEGIPTLCDFFSSTLAKKLKSEYGQADVVIANNVFAHIDDLTDVVVGIGEILKPNGFFVFEVSYLKDVFEQTLFDTIYHEHLSYHSVKPLQTFFEKNGMELFDVQRVPTHGGSLRGFAQFKNGPRKVTSNVEAFLKAEADLGLYKSETFVAFASQIENLKLQLNDMLKELKDRQKKIAGFGAPAKATTLMHHFNLNKDFIEFIVDENPLKQGLYSPGLHVPITAATTIDKEKPDYLVILAWNFADTIISKNKDYLKNGGGFIVPLPVPKIVTKDNL